MDTATAPDDSDSGSGGDEYEDASSSFPASEGPELSPVDHATGLATIQKALDLTNDNKLFEAEAMLKPWVETSMYHCVAYATLLFMKAAMSNDTESIRQAQTALNSCLELSNRSRKNRGVLKTLSNWVFGQNLDEYSETELAAEIFYTESNLMLALLTFVQDENLISFIKGGLKVRICYGHFKQMYAWLQTCEQEGRHVEVSFATGVRQGVGCFNLLLSSLPQRVLRLLEFVGFSGDRKLGLELLTMGAESGTYRDSLCASFLLFYHAVGSVMLGVTDFKTEVSEKLLQPHLEKHPTSPLFLYFKGRVALMRGDVDKAIEAFRMIVDEHTQWEQVHHLSWWELMWCHCYKTEWALAASYADKVFKGSKWSKATFLYQNAALLLMLRTSGPTDLATRSGEIASGQSDVAKSVGEIAPGVTREDIVAMMKQIPPLKQRIAGKSLPVEKLAVAKSERYLQGARLPLPALEMMFVWNGFRLLAMNPPLLENMLRLVLSELVLIEESKGENPWYVDDFVVVSLIQGVCLKELRRLDEAEITFQNILERSAGVQHDHYAVAAANMELGLVYLETDRLADAERALETTKASYKGYHMESRIHFRVHAGLSKLAQLKAAKA